MAIAGAPEATLEIGGKTSQGPAKGVYRIFVNDSVIGKASAKTGRLPLELDIFVKGDPDHPEKEGKRLEKYRSWLPMTSDDNEKKEMMKGMLKRQVYLPFDVEFPKENKTSLDTRQFAGKVAWALVGDVKQEDNTFRNGIVAFAATKDKLPTPRTTTAEPVDGAKKAAGTKRR